MTIYVLKYNNYYNRILKKLDTVNQYLTAKVWHQDYDFHENVSFNPNDGVTTSQVVNFDASKYDYVLAADNNGEIQSRWFIIEAQRNRTGQYTLQLQRDIVADYFDDIKNSPMFIEKATVGVDDPAIFNSEEMSFNQIKTKETLLKDKTGVPWIVIYAASKDSEGTATSFSGSVAFKQDADFDLSGQTSTSWEFYNTTVKAIPNEYQFGMRYYYTYLGATNKRVNLFNQGNVTDIINQDYPGGQITNGYNLGTGNGLRTHLSNSWYAFDTLLDEAQSKYGYLTSVKEAELLNYQDKVIQFSNGLFKVEITKSLIDVKQEIADDGSILVEDLKNTTNVNLTNIGVSHEGPYGDTFFLIGKQYQYTTTLTQVAGATTYSYNFPATRNHLTDNPYDIILMPFGRLWYRTENLGTIRTADKDVAYLIAQDIARANIGAKKILDIQILPYCSETAWAKGNLMALYNLSSSDYAIIKDSSDNPVTFALFGTKSSFTVRVNATCSSEDTETDNIGYKTRVETDMYRVCSPNYAGAFEFNNIKAGYKTSKMDFDIDCTYLPYNPYIHVTPVFRGQLYGQDFDDARGLVCGGDFSMAMASSAWETYQIQNKNYQTAFDRSIQNLEINQTYARVGDIASAITGTVQGAAVGAQLGGGSLKNANPYGAGIGAAVGTVVAGAAGGADFALNEMMRKEVMDYTKDNFGYSLGNIKALPESLAKTTAYTYNNKYFPFVEYYTCTDVEKKALQDKIKYNGMTIMRIGNIEEFLREEETYIKGQLIRSESINCDEHELQAIAIELNKGLFMKG